MHALETQETGTEKKNVRHLSFFIRKHPKIILMDLVNTLP